MSKIDAFPVVLHNPKRRSYIRLGLVLVFINAATFLLFLFSASLFKTGLSGLIVLAIYFGLKWLEVRKNPRADQIDDYAFFILAIIWMNANFLIALLLLVTGLLLRISLTPFKYVFGREEIVKAFFPRKTYSWNEVDSVILKAGLLTINFKDDRLIQGVVEWTGNFDVEQFNEFVAEQLQH